LAANLIVKDFGWTKISRELKLMDGSYTKVGFPENAEVKKPSKKIKGEKVATDMSEIAIVAAFNEFGTSGTKSSRSGGSSVKIPPRPFMSTSFDESMDGLNRLKQKLYIKIINGEITLKVALSIIGEYMVAKTKKKIRDIKSPPNAPSTIKKKKSSNPLIDSGQMINSVTHVEVLK